MIKHVIMFRLKATEDPAEGRRRLEHLRAMIEEMPRQIALIRDLEVGTNLARVETAFDLVAILLFSNWDDFMEYVAHPVHVRVSEYLGIVREASAVVDFETAPRPAGASGPSE